MRSKHKLLVFAHLLDSSSCILSDTSSIPSVVWLPLWRPVSLSAHPIYPLSLFRSPPESLASAPHFSPSHPAPLPTVATGKPQVSAPSCFPICPRSVSFTVCKGHGELGDIWVPWRHGMEISFHPVISAPHPHPCFFGAAFFCFLFCFVNAFYLILFLSLFFGQWIKKKIFF